MTSESAAPGPDPAKTTKAIVRDDRILPEVRLIAACLPLVLIAAFILLYLWPDATDRTFAWTIKPTMTAMFMGAGYVSGIYFFVFTAVGKRWHRVAVGFPAISVFTWLMAVATFLHWDKFDHGHISFWVWLGLYLVTPLLVPAMWLRNHPTDPGVPEPNDLVVPPPLRLAAGVIGALLVVLSLVCFVWPDLMIGVWPWALTPLTARVLCGWLALFGMLQAGLSRESRWSSWRIPVESQIISMALVLIAGMRAAGEFDLDRVATPIVVGAFIIWFLLVAILEVVMLRRLAAATGASRLEAGAARRER